MTISLKHAFASGKSDGSDSSFVQPSNWNAEHTLSMATARLLGRVTAGSGTFEELTADQIWTFLGFVATTTRLLFHQTTPPTGWTKDTGINDKGLRVTSGTVGSGGTIGFTTAFGTAIAGSSTVLTQANLPSGIILAGSTSSDGNHTHTEEGSTSNGTAGSGSAKNVTQGNSQNTGSSGAHTHTVTVALGGSGTGHSHTVNMNVLYVDVIIASKS